MSHRALSPQQFDISQELGLHPSIGADVDYRGVAEGRVAKHIMHQAGIRQIRGEDAPHEITGVKEPERGYPEGELLTSQRHLHLPTLRRYAQGDIPETDPDYFDKELGRSEMPYEPETYEHGGKRFVMEGHHRLVARRLAR